MYLDKENAEKFKDLAESLLLPSTVEAYNNSFENMNNLIGSKSADNLKNWLDYWHNHRCNIFKAFTGHKYPRSNLAEVIHTSWMQHVSLQLESEINQFGFINEPAPGTEPAMTSWKSRFFENEKEATVQKPSDFGCSGVKPSCKKRKKNTIFIFWPCCTKEELVRKWICVWKAFEFGNWIKNSY